MIVSKEQRWLDGAAIGASTLCLIHCLALPMLIVLLPSLAGFLTLPETFHVWAVAFAIPTSALALVSGYRRHRRPRPTFFVVPGIVLLAAGAFAAPSEVAETALTVAGAVLLAFGHALNWRAIRHADCPPQSHREIKV